MNTSILFTPQEIAQFSGVPEGELRKHEPEDWLTPRHWVLSGAHFAYTLDGARLLAQAISMSGNEVGAAALLDAVNKVEASRAAPALEQSHQPHWMNRKDLQ